MKELISIIVPVYNTEKYLEKCLDTLIAQTYGNLEILVIDDGSTDGSPAICDRYAEIDERVKVIHTPNRGLSAARNLALERAKGQYFGFVDSDDYVETNMFEKLHAGIKESGCDICACGSLREAGGKVARKYTYNQNAVLDRAGFLELFFDEFNCVNMWNKLFRAEVFRGIRFPEGHNYEDVWIFPEILDQDVRIYVMRDALYHYVQRSGSIIQSWTYRNAWDSLNSKETFAYYAKNRNPHISRKIAQYLVKIYVAHWYILNLVYRNCGDEEERAWIRSRQGYVREEALRLYHSCRPIRISPVKKLAIKAMERCPDVAKNLFLEYRKDEWTM